MNISEIFIRRPVATTLLTAGIVLAGIVSFHFLPVAPLPRMDLPTISVQASLPGASPETMAATVATPLERTLGRIAGLSDMTSSSSTGSTRITMQFDLGRDIDGAARDVQAAINASRSLLPANLPRNPSYYKVNPADSPIMILSLTSEQLGQGEMYDAASSVLVQKLSQIEGIGQVVVGGSSLPAVRVSLNPDALNKYGISTENVRQAIDASNPHRPKGVIESQTHSWYIAANDTAKKAKDYLPLILGYNNGSPVRLSDVGDVVDSVQDIRNAGSSNGKPSVLLMLYKQPDANIIRAVEDVRERLPELRGYIASSIDLDIVMDRTTTIRVSLAEVEHALILSVFLVILVVLFFLRDWRATLVPIVAVSASLIGTFAVMYVAGFSLNNLSLMALVIASGFVVDDAIVVLENCKRHRDEGLSAMISALIGSREVSFTVISMSISLIAVFMPILFMGGVVGRLFSEFAMTLCAAITISLVMSLTVTPMMCAYLFTAEKKKARGQWYEAGEVFFNFLTRHYEKSLNWTLAHKGVIFMLLAAAVGLNIYLCVIIPKGLFPRQDTGRLAGFIQADQGISFIAMNKKMDEFVRAIRQDPAVENVVAYIGGGQRNSGTVFVMLKPLAERKVGAQQIIDRLKERLSGVPGARLSLQASQDISIGARQSSAQYQYTVEADDLAELRKWTPRIASVFSRIPGIKDVSTDQQTKGIETQVIFDRDTMYRLGLTPALVDSALNDAYGQRLVSNIHNPLNQYHVVMEVDEHYRQGPEALKAMKVIGPSGEVVPLAAFAQIRTVNTALSVSHQGQFAASTISFNLQEGVSLSDVSKLIKAGIEELNPPDSVHGGFEGTAKLFEESLKNQPLLVGIALITIYIVLGMLYESYIHPITILSAIPSAGTGALLMMLILKTEFTVIAFIGITLLVGIVMKNAIMMIDFAIEIEREDDLPAKEAIYQACLLRFRPILMTTLTALLGAVPLAVGTGDGAELRQPLGICIVGGLLVSQVLTLYSTPVIYMYFDELRVRFRTWRRLRKAEAKLGRS